MFKDDFTSSCSKVVIIHFFKAIVIAVALRFSKKKNLKLSPVDRNGNQAAYVKVSIALVAV